MDKKRHILIREMMGLISQASALRDEIGVTFQQAYQSLQQANVTMGLIQPYTLDVPVEEGLSISHRSVMGVDLPILRLEEQPLTPTLRHDSDQSCPGYGGGELSPGQMPDRDLGGD